MPHTQYEVLDMIRKYKVTVAVIVQNKLNDKKQSVFVKNCLMTGLHIFNNESGSKSKILHYGI